jgi:hypothetical protein
MRYTRPADAAHTRDTATGALRFGRAPGAWPFLGHAVALLRRPLPLLDSLPAHGDLVEIRLGPRPAFVLCHPDLARSRTTGASAWSCSPPFAMSTYAATWP